MRGTVVRGISSSIAGTEIVYREEVLNITGGFCTSGTILLWSFVWFYLELSYSGVPSAEVCFSLLLTIMVETVVHVTEFSWALRYEDNPVNIPVMDATPSMAKRKSRSTHGLKRSWLLTQAMECTPCGRRKDASYTLFVNVQLGFRI
jgi:hypothetical protein